uniref:16S rRNA (Guanine(527)-N(7))-methyltransferase RsmG n=1 Tax=Heterorhabditis bacteriophora TaxID=37862 RepID=A0A1I7WQI2_HETBA
MNFYHKKKLDFQIFEEFNLNFLDDKTNILL